MDKLANNPKFQAFDSNGDPLNGGKLHTYEVGGTTNKATYKDRILDTANTNPIVLDSRGECVVYFSGTIKLVLKTSADVEIWSMDNLAIDDAITSLLGFAIRSNFTWKDADQIYINPGVYEINGKIVQWSSQLTSDIGSPDVSDWYYLYLDDSAIGTASKTLTASDFIWSNTEPAWSNAKHGWYNGEDRCIFAVLTDGSSNILEFFHDGDFVLYADTINDLSALDLANDFSDEITLTVPIFARKIQCYFRYDYSNASATALWRTEGQAANAAHQIGYATAASAEVENIVNVICSANLKIDVKDSTAATNTLYETTDGFYLPVGM